MQTNNLATVMLPQQLALGSGIAIKTHMHITFFVWVIHASLFFRLWWEVLNLDNVFCFISCLQTSLFQWIPLTKIINFFSLSLSPEINIVQTADDFCTKGDISYQ